MAAVPMEMINSYDYMAYQNFARSICMCNMACDYETDVNQRKLDHFSTMSYLLLTS